MFELNGLEITVAVRTSAAPAVRLPVEAEIEVNVGVVSNWRSSSGMRLMATRL
jgi:hypothetical protein